MPICNKPSQSGISGRIFRQMSGRYIMLYPLPNKAASEFANSDKNRDKKWRKTGGFEMNLKNTIGKSLVSDNLRLGNRDSKECRGVSFDTLRALFPDAS